MDLLIERKFADVLYYIGTNEENVRLSTLYNNNVLFVLFTSDTF